MFLNVMCNNVQDPSYYNFCKKLERDLIIIFKNNYLQREDYGNEYFEGNHKDMIKDITNIVLN